MVQRDFTFDYSKLEESIVSWMKNHVKDNGLESLAITVSGNICSTVSSTLAAKTNLPVRALIQKNGQEDILVNHVEWLKNNFSNVSFFDSDSLLTPYQIAKDHNGIVIESVTNIDTFLLGTLTSYESDCLRLLPFADLYESDVHEIGKILNVINPSVSCDETFEWSYQWCVNSELIYPPESSEIVEELSEDRLVSLQNYRQLYLQNSDKIEKLNNAIIYTFAVDYNFET